MFDLWNFAEVVLYRVSRGFPSKVPESNNGKRELREAAASHGSCRVMHPFYIPQGQG